MAQVNNGLLSSSCSKEEVGNLVLVLCFTEMKPCGLSAVRNNITLIQSVNTFTLNIKEDGKQIFSVFLQVVVDDP